MLAPTVRSTRSANESEVSNGVSSTRAGSRYGLRYRNKKDRYGAQGLDFNDLRANRNVAAIRLASSVGAGIHLVPAGRGYQPTAEAQRTSRVRVRSARSHGTSAARLRRFHAPGRFAPPGENLPPGWRLRRFTIALEPFFQRFTVATAGIYALRRLRGVGRNLPARRTRNQRSSRGAGASSGLVLVVASFNETAV